MLLGTIQTLGPPRGRADPVDLEPFPLIPRADGRLPMIGIFGGTFDPIHFGHLRPALDCFQNLGLSELRLVPLNLAVHRPQPLAPASLRLEMLEAAISGQSGFVADPRELNRPGRSYSRDTLVSVRGEIGQHRPLCLLVGDDAFAGFMGWYRPFEILELAHLVVMRRPPGACTKELDPDLKDLYQARGCDGPETLYGSPAGLILMQDVTQLDISSTHVRSLIAQGYSPRYLVPDPVLTIIERTGLYRESKVEDSSPG